MVDSGRPVVERKCVGREFCVRSGSSSSERARKIQEININGFEGVFNISGKDFLTPYQMAMKTAEFFNLDTSLIHKTDSNRFTQPAKRPLITGFIIKKAEDELNYYPHTFEEGLSILADQIDK